MQQIDLSEVARQQLLEAGWFPGRHIDIQPFLHTLEQEGYDVPASVHSFLAEFGGIRLNFSYIEYVETKLGGRDVLFKEHIDFNPIHAADNIIPEKLHFFTSLVRQRLCVIGEYQDTTLLMDTTGRVYSAFGWDLYQCGETGARAIETMLEKGKFSKVEGVGKPPSLSSNS